MNKDNICTENLADFCSRERSILLDILKAWEIHGLPAEFYDDNVRPMFNRNSGDVFLTNSEYQVCVEAEGKLEMFYSCPECGCEGFKEELEDVDYSHECCRNYIKEIYRKDEFCKRSNDIS